MDLVKAPEGRASRQHMEEEKVQAEKREEWMERNKWRDVRGGERRREEARGGERRREEERGGQRRREEARGGQRRPEEERGGERRREEARGRREEERGGERRAAASFLLPWLTWLLLHPHTGTWVSLYGRVRVRVRVLVLQRIYPGWQQMVQYLQYFDF